MQTADLQLLGTFSIPPEHPSLPGHFPGEPIVPGSVLIDHAMSYLAEFGTGPLHTARIRRLKFSAMVRPGQEVQIHGARKGHQIRFRCLAGGHAVVDGQIDLDPAADAPSSRAAPARP
ncbi:hypothetical protein [Halorhodospira sp. M39old]|uniref:hypothetical protein n=1 Tax=unclassified Halorhodospira TaxID=2626748 RepID=UPI001EE7ECF4|nr:hypothetical protein [Halorhodospira sp. M39old]MCG5540245.1 hypothetical protein [Halorhodospira sp. M39old]MCG5545054.1 hypothetical protein [Halorhodospira sp. M38]